MAVMVETPRLVLRELNADDLDAVHEILGDLRVMGTAWEHAFTRAEAAEWLGKNVGRYGRDGFSYWAAVEKESGILAGLLGLLMEEVDGERIPGLGWILRYDCWGRGYAREGALGCARYAFEQLKLGRVIAEIRPENKPSLRVALSLGMRQYGSFTKRYRGKDMPHELYELTKEMNCGSSAEERGM